MGGCDDPVCVVALCRRCHRRYDEEAFDLLPYLTTKQQQHAVSHIGLSRALARITGGKIAPPLD